MADAKIQALTRKLIFGLLVLFPFGQLFRVDLVPAWGVRFQAVDILATLAIPLVFLVRRKNRPLFKASLSLWVVFAFSLVIYAAQDGIALNAILYLIRFTAYLALLNLAVATIQGAKMRAQVVAGLMLVALASAFLGWYQYFVYPDFRPFKIIGWDDHLFRLVGSFLDPGFLGIVLCLGFILVLGRYLAVRQKRFIVAAMFLLVTIAFTYSRASYMAVAVGTLALFYVKKLNSAFVILFLGLFSILLLLLPRPSSEGVKLERVASIGARVINYDQTLGVWQRSPVFGVGFNNICSVRQKVDPKESFASHSCSGADSSLLFVLATTGIVGLLSFVIFWGRVVWERRGSEYGPILIASAGAVLVHSNFTNSLFYPWVLIWFALLLGATTEAPIGYKKA